MPTNQDIEMTSVRDVFEVVGKLSEKKAPLREAIAKIAELKGIDNQDIISACKVKATKFSEKYTIFSALDQ